MALSSFVRHDAAVRAFAIIGSAAGRLRPGEIAGRIIAHFGGMTDRGDQTAVFNIVRATQRTFDDAVAAVAAGINSVFDPRQRDWTLFGQAQPFGYKVEVVLRDQATGQHWRQLYTVESAVPLTPREAMEIAEADARQNAPNRRTNPVRDSAMPDIQITTRLVAGGRLP